MAGIAGTQAKITWFMGSKTLHGPEGRLCLKGLAARPLMEMAVFPLLKVTMARHADASGS
ncbi:hypothetical protein ATN00_03910 [Sphingobium baderi]|uniref:Uncharacterized protein n=1 Tax=Sphingobium baderi TaxID=1332080 RepID=A0A0S3EVX4_9SPHN|nr:hypothetical protein ATN00_03910 [Sphingobium baderi]